MCILDVVVVIALIIAYLLLLLAVDTNSYLLYYCRKDFILQDCPDLYNFFYLDGYIKLFHVFKILPFKKYDNLTS